MRYLFMMVLAFAACSQDGDNKTIEEDPDRDKPQMENASFTFSVNLPAQANPSPRNNSGANGGISSYALGALDENAVNHIYVLAFKQDAVPNPNTYELADWAEASSIEDITSGTDGNEKRFKVKFSKLEKNSKYKFVIITNAKAEVDLMFSSHSITYGAEKDATLALLKLTGVERWVEEGSSTAIRAFPMWGESTLVTAEQHMEVDKVKLLRMVAKINVTVDPAVSDCKSSA